MRIAYFITAFGLGGAEMQVYLIAREMQRRGADVIVVRLKDTPSGLLHKLSESGIPTTSLHFNYPLQMLIAHGVILSKVDTRKQAHYDYGDSHAYTGKAAQAYVG